MNEPRKCFAICSNCTREWFVCDYPIKREDFEKIKEDITCPSCGSRECEVGNKYLIEQIVLNRTKGTVMDLKLRSGCDVQLVQHMGGDSFIVAAAKVSTSGEDAKMFVDEDANYGLINYLMKHRHGTPFEHGAMTFFVRAPIFVWREWHRHRIGFSYNEESGRYKTLEPEFFIPSKERALGKVESWKAGRPKFEPVSSVEYRKVVNSLRSGYELSYAAYQAMLAQNIDPGVARAVLGVGIYSSCWVTCNPRSMMSFLSLRTHRPDSATFVSYPQREIEEAAEKCEELFATLWPLTYRAFCENGRVAP